MTGIIDSSIKDDGTSDKGHVTLIQASFLLISFLIRKTWANV